MGIIAFLAIFPLIFLLDEPTPNVKKYCVASMAGILLVACSIVVFAISDRGRWEAVQADPTPKKLAAFLTNRPNSDYATAASLLLDERQVAQLEAAKSPVARAILESLIAQPHTTARLEVFVGGDRAYNDDDSGKANTRRYDTAMRKFERLVVSVVSELAWSVGADTKQLQDLESRIGGDVFVVDYSAAWAAEFTQNGVYYFNSISLSAKWKLIQNAAVTHSGNTMRYYVPTNPHWEGTKTPEEVVSDFLIQDTVGELADLLGVSRPDLGAINW